MMSQKGAVHLDLTNFQTHHLEEIENIFTPADPYTQGYHMPSGVTSRGPPGPSPLFLKYTAISLANFVLPVLIYCLAPLNFPLHMPQPKNKLAEKKQCLP